MRVSYLLFFCILLLLCSSIQVVTAAEEYAYIGQIGAMGPPIDPRDVAVDSAGNVLVTDSENNRIQKFAPNGTYLAQWGSPGSGDGQFNYPKEIALDRMSNIYITDTGNQRVQKFTPNGTYLTQWGIGIDQYDHEAAIAVDSVDNVYVVDAPPSGAVDSSPTGYYFRVQKFTSNGTPITTWTLPYLDPRGPYWPGRHAVAVDSQDNVYVTDYYTSSAAHDVSQNARVLKFTSTGALIAQWGTHGTGDGQFTDPLGISFDHADNVYVSDGYRIQKFTSGGTFITQWGEFGEEDGQFKCAYGLAVDSAGNVFVADTANQRVQKFTSTGTYLTQWGNPYDLRGKCRGPLGVAVDNAGFVFVPDSAWGKRRIQKFTSDGNCVTAWGGEDTGAGPLGWLVAIAVDSTGNVYVADSENNKIVKFTSNGAFITEWGTSGSGDGQFNGLNGIAVDTADNVYVTEGVNFRVQKFTSTGTFLKKWGTAGTDEGRFWFPGGIGVDSAGNVYVADWGDRIQKFTSTGEFITTWGSTGSGNGQFHGPADVAVDGTDLVFVTDCGNNRTQVFDSNGAFITAWGSAGSEVGQFNGPQGIAVDGAGIVYIADTGNNRIQMFAPTGISVASITPTNAGITTKDVGVVVRGRGFPTGSTFHLVNTTLGTIECLPNTLTWVSETELRGNLSLADAKEGFYDVVVTTPDGGTDSLEKGFHVSPIPVLLIHGRGSNGEIWSDLEASLRANGIPYWSFDYADDSTGSPVPVAEKLKQFIEEKRETEGYTGKIDIVCHSMGAIVSRWYMEQLDGGIHGAEVREWIGIAPAHGGSALTDVHWDENWKIAQAILNGICGDSYEQLRTTSYPVSTLRTSRLSSSTTYKVIAGWNPRQSYWFGWGYLFPTTWAKSPTSNGTTASYYITYNGDSIIATAQSYHPDMGFDCFPILSDPDGGAGDPAKWFDHTDIYKAPPVIRRVITYLKNPETPSSNIVPSDEPRFFTYERPVYITEKTWFGWLHDWLTCEACESDRINIAVGDSSGPSLDPGLNRQREALAMSASETLGNGTLIVDLNWTEGDASLALTSPSGEAFTATSGQPTVLYSDGSNSISYFIAFPEKGNWSVSIKPSALPDHPVRYNLTSRVVTLNPSGATPTPTVTSTTTSTQTVTPTVTPTTTSTQTVTPTVTPTPTQDPRAPVANFTWTPVNVTVGVPFIFWDCSTNSPTAWRWMQNGIEISTMQNLSGTATIPGTRSISLMAMNEYGWSLPKTVVIDIANPSATPTPTVKPLFGGGSPTETNNDGKYDDVNGNGRPDFADVVLYFNQMSWIAANEPLSAFDYNANGRIDFADVVWLFNHL